MKNYKVFIWDDVLWDWGPGHIVVIALNVEQARQTVKDQLDDCHHQSALKVFTDEPTILKVPVMIDCWGTA